MAQTGSSVSMRNSFVFNSCFRNQEQESIEGLRAYITAFNAGRTDRSTARRAKLKSFSTVSPCQGYVSVIFIKT